MLYLHVVRIHLKGCAESLHQCKPQQKPYFVPDKEAAKVGAYVITVHGCLAHFHLLCLLSLCWVRIHYTGTQGWCEYVSYYGLPFPGFHLLTNLKGRMNSRLGSALTVQAKDPTRVYGFIVRNVNHFTTDTKYRKYETFKNDKCDNSNTTIIVMQILGSMKIRSDK